LVIHKKQLDSILFIVGDHNECYSSFTSTNMKVGSGHVLSYSLDHNYGL